MPYSRKRYEYNPHTPICFILDDLAESRKGDNIYLTARIVQTLQERGMDVSLTAPERELLLTWLRKARFAKQKPMASWLPRGYQIVRLLSTIKGVLPNRKIVVSKRDRRFIVAAENHYRGRIKKDDQHAPAQLQSLYRSLRFLGLR